MKRNRAVLNERRLSSIVLSPLNDRGGCVSAIVLPPETGEGLTTLVGWLLVLNGATEVAYAWRTRHSGGHRLAMILVGSGIVCVIAGGCVLVHPLMGFAPLTFVWLIYLFGKSLLGSFSRFDSARCLGRVGFTSMGLPTLHSWNGARCYMGHVAGGLPVGDRNLGGHQHAVQRGGPADGFPARVAWLGPLTRRFMNSSKLATSGKPQ